VIFIRVVVINMDGLPGGCHEAYPFFLNNAGKDDRRHWSTFTELQLHAWKAGFHQHIYPANKMDPPSTSIPGVSGNLDRVARYQNLAPRLASAVSTRPRLFPA